MKQKRELRECVIGKEKKKAFFHCWEDNSYIVEPSIMVGGQKGGVVQATYAIIEYEDGTVRRAAPPDVRFIDRE